MTQNDDDIQASDMAGVARMPSGKWSCSDSKGESSTDHSIRSCRDASKKRRAAENSHEKDEERNSKQTKIAGVPTRPLSAYNFFFKEERIRWLEEHKSSNQYGATGGKDGGKKESAFCLAAKAIGERWRQLTAEQRKRYEKSAERDLKRYRKELQDYKDNLIRETTVEISALESNLFPGSWGSYGVPERDLQHSVQEQQLWLPKTHPDEQLRMNTALPLLQSFANQHPPSQNSLSIQDNSAGFFGAAAPIAQMYRIAPSSAGFMSQDFPRQAAYASIRELEQLACSHDVRVPSHDGLTSYDNLSYLLAQRLLQARGCDSQLGTSYPSQISQRSHLSTTDFDFMNRQILSTGAVESLSTNALSSIWSIPDKSSSASLGRRFNPLTQIEQQHVSQQLSGCRFDSRWQQQAMQSSYRPEPFRRVEFILDFPSASDFDIRQVLANPSQMLQQVGNRGNSMLFRNENLDRNLSYALPYMLSQVLQSQYMPYQVRSSLSDQVTTFEQLQLLLRRQHSNHDSCSEYGGGLRDSQGL